MADELVKIYVTDELGAALAGVMVRAYDSTGTTLITQNQSSVVGSDAIAELTIPVTSSPREIQLRLSKDGVAFDGLLGNDSKTPQKADIYSPVAGAPTGKNDFDAQGQTFTRPAATDPQLCRCSITFRDVRKQARKGQIVILSPQSEPIMVGGDAMAFTNVTLKTDNNGYAQVDLVRGARLSAYVRGLEDEVRVILVPDVSSANLADLMFPVVSEVTFSPTSLALAVGETKEITPTVKTSDGRTLTGAALEDVEFVVNHAAVALGKSDGTKLFITGVAAGATQVLVARLDTTTIFVPDAGITYTPPTITVS